MFEQLLGFACTKRSDLLSCSLGGPILLPVRAGLVKNIVASYIIKNELLAALFMKDSFVEIDLRFDIARTFTDKNSVVGPDSKLELR